MYRGDPSSPTQFSVHAEITISHPRDEDSRNRPRTNLERDEATGGIRMTYSWKPEYEGRSQSEERTSATRRSVWPSSSTNSNNSTFSDSRSSATITPQRTSNQKIVPPSTLLNNNYTRCYQKGNLYFTSTPPTNTEPIRNIPNNSALYNPLSRGIVHDSSGYGSDLLSPNSQGNTLPKRPIQQYDRKCRSTCNITLSTNFPGSQELMNANYSQCGRTQSLRCQTPSSSLQKNPLRFYGCGDPWCHHLKLSDDLASVCRISPVPEETPPNTINNSKLPSRSNTYSVADHESTKKDASVQTFEMVDKCTSPFSRINSTDSMDSRYSKKYQRRGLTVPVNFGGKIRNTGSSGKVHSSTGNYTPDSLDSVKPSSRKLVRSPKLRKKPAKSSNHVKDTKKEQSPALKASTSQKKPRTVHIDVYCTGTEQESSSESSDEGSKSASTPQTVYENEKVRITHRKAGEDELPFFLKRIVDQVQNEGPQSLFTKPKVLQKDNNMSMQKDESDDEIASTAYPSKMSSYSNVGDLSASLSSVPPSWATYSMSSCAIPELDDYDSIANTSWKDTFSDIDSLMSRSSLAASESLDFVPVRKRLETTESIDEAPEYLNKLEVPQMSSVASLQTSDSFEYANSEDKARIRRMEDMWKFKAGGRFLRSPQARKQLELQQKRIQEYMENKISSKKKWDSKDSDSNESDDPGKSYTFIKKSVCKKGCCEDVDDEDREKEKSPSNLLPNTIRDALLRSVTPEKTLTPPDTLSLNSQSPESVIKNRQINIPPVEDQGSVTDTSPTSPENRTYWQRFAFDPNLRSPFMVVPGIYTEPRSIARKFGNVVRVMKKPGHHVGPAKNPDCLCDHCQSYWQNVGCRGRTRSVGDAPVKFVQNWKELLDQMGNGHDNAHEKSPFSDIL